MTASELNIHNGGVKKNVMPFLAVLVLVFGLIAVLLSVKHTQNIKNKASAPISSGSLSLTPISALHYVGDIFPVNIKFNTGGASISSITLRLVYRFTGTTPQMDVTDQNGNVASQIAPDPGLLSSGDWSFAVNSVTRDTTNGTVTIDLAATNVNIAGYNNISDTNLATIYFKANSPTGNLVNLDFDPNLSTMMTKSDPTNILNPPVGGTYSVAAKTLHPVHWQTQTVTLDASDFYIIAGNQLFTGTPDPGHTVYINPWPGDSGQSTLEVTWQEHGVEMRIFFYFESDGTNWWSYNLSTYDGQPQGNWISYTQKRFLSPLGQVYATPDFTISNNSGPINGSVHFSNLSLQAFTTPIPNPVLNYKYRLQGVNGSGPVSVPRLTVKDPSTGTVLFGAYVYSNSDANGVYTGMQDIGNLPPGVYDVYLQDQTHLQKKFASVGVSQGVNNEDWTATPLLASDFNGDNQLDIIDLGKWLSVYTQLTVPVDNTNQQYDVNGDGVIDIQDIAIILSNYTQLTVKGD